MAQNANALVLATNRGDQHHQQHRQRDVDNVPARQHDRLAGHAAVELQEGDDGPGEGEGADRGPERHLDETAPLDVAGRADAERLRRVERAGGHDDGRKTDEAVEEGDELGHRRHLHGAGAPCPDPAADRDADDHEQPADGIGRRP